MGKQITFTTGVTDTEVVAVAGSVEYGGDHDERGGATIPNAIAGEARTGKCDVVVTEANEAALIALQSPVGAGAYTVGAGTGDDIDASQIAYEALVDVEFGGDAVQVATISWKGTKEPAA